MTTDLMRRPASLAVVGGVGCALLLARPLLWQWRALDPVVMVVVLFIVLGVAGTSWPVSRPDVAAAGVGAAVAPVGQARDRLLVLWIGVAAFGLGRAIGGGVSPLPLLPRWIALNSLAAVAEEAFFRRFLYGALERLGPVVAVAGSTAAFAACHVTVYGFWVLPIDLAAGGVLGWQRWATGSWRVPAITHVIANALVVA